MIFQYCWRQVLIQRILIGFEAIHFFSMLLYNKSNLYFSISLQYKYLLLFIFTQNLWKFINIQNLLKMKKLIVWYNYWCVILIVFTSFNCINLAREQSMHRFLTRKTCSIKLLFLGMSVCLSVCKMDVFFKGFTAHFLTCSCF